MDNKTLTFILKMRDEATKSYGSFKSNVQKGMSDLKSTFGGFKSILAGAFSVVALKSFIKASNEQEKATSDLAQALKNQGVISRQVQADMEAFSSAMQKQTTFGDEAITNIQTMLVSMTGLTGKAVQPLTKATLDLAVGMRMDVESVALLISKTLEGQDALGRYGISTKNAATESEKLAMILEGVAKKFGGRAAAEAQTTAGRMKMLANQVGDLKEQFGDLIKKVLEPLIPILGKVIVALQELPAPVTAAILVIGALTVAILGLNAALLANPITWIILGIAGAVTALGFAFGKTNPKMKEAETEINNNSRAVLEYRKSLVGTGLTYVEINKKVEIYIGQLKELVKTKVGLKNVTGETVITLTSIGIEIKKLSESLEKIDIKSPKFKETLIAIEKLQKKLSEATTIVDYQKGSMEDLKNRASELQSTMDKLNTTTESGYTVWKNLLYKLNEVNREIEWLNKLKKVLSEPMILTFQTSKIDPIQLKEEMKVIEPILADFPVVEIFDTDMFAQNAELIKGGLSIISQFSSQATQGRIDGINAEKEAALGAIDAELAGQNISEERRTELLARRSATEAGYNEQIRGEKRRAFSSHKTASIIEAIINTAVAYTKTLGQLGIFGIPMAAFVAALGALQVTLIASQPVPRFHKGGKVYFDAPAASETDIRIRGGETVRINTREQERQKKESRGKVTVIINFNTPVPHGEWIKKSIEAGMRATHLTVDEYLIGNRNMISI